MKIQKFALTAASLMALVLVQACDPVPRRTLSLEEKQADLMWIYSQFGEEYAPLEYKESRFNFNFSELKQKYLNEAANTHSNEEFYNLMYQFVAEFKDAHTSASLTTATLPGRATVSYLGFSGSRKGDNLIVTQILPTITSESNFPIEKDDLILSIDGVDLKEAVNKTVLKFRDIGREESNYTMGMNKLFTRVSTANGQPDKTTAKLRVKRDSKEFDVELPWITKDILDFKREQAAAAPKKADAPAKVASVALQDANGKTLYSLSAMGFDGNIFDPEALEAKMKRTNTKYRFWDGFRFIDNFASWVISGESSEKTPAEKLKEKRNVPSKAVFIDAAKTYPAYVYREKKGTDSKLIGYIYLDTFSPDGDESAVLDEFKETLTAFKELGAKDIIIDMVNNGGGSLVLGMQLAQALSDQKIDLPELQYRLSDTWLDQFETEMRTGEGDTNRELARRILTEMKDDQKAGLRLSRKYNAETLAPYAIKPNSAITEKFNVVLMVNEMCASMCDIYSAILKDNGMAKIVGQNTMGAGGNVVSIDQAPNSHLTLRQTESLIVRKDGSYIENNGVAVDVEINVSSSVDSKYDDVKKKAVEALF